MLLSHGMSLIAAALCNVNPSNQERLDVSYTPAPLGPPGLGRLKDVAVPLGLSLDNLLQCHG